MEVRSRLRQPRWWWWSGNHMDKGSDWGWKSQYPHCQVYEGWPCRREYSHAGWLWRRGPGQWVRVAGRRADLFLVLERVAIKHRMGSLMSEMTSQAYCSWATNWKVGWNDSLELFQLQGIMTLNLQKLPNYYMLNAKPVSKGNLILIYYFHFSTHVPLLKKHHSASLMEISDIELFFGDFISCLQIVVGEHQLKSSDNRALLGPIGISLFN